MFWLFDNGMFRVKLYAYDATITGISEVVKVKIIREYGQGALSFIVKVGAKIVFLFLF